MEDQTLFKEQPLLPDGPFDQLLILAGPAPDSGASLAEAGGCRIFKIYLGENNVLGQVNNAFIRAAAQRNHLLVVWALVPRPRIEVTTCASGSFCLGARVRIP